MSKNTSTMLGRHITGVWIATSFRLCVVVALLAFSTASTSATTPTLRVMTANTAAETGIIQALVDDFQKRHPEITVKVDSAGALQVLDNGRQGQADLIITHQPQAEMLFITEGYGLRHASFMYNEFAIFGPRADPLHLSGERDLMKVLRQLASNEVPFIVAGERSGTAARLNALWTLAGVTPDWVGYESQNSSAASTLANAAMFEAYTFADLGTYYTNRTHYTNDFVPLYRDHILLRNTYSAIVVNPKRISDANRIAADAFFDYLVSDDGQTLISQFSESRFAAPLFTPSAHLDADLHAERARQEIAAQQRTLTRLTSFVVVLLLVSGVAIWLYWRGRQLESARRLSEARFTRAVAGTNDGIWDWDVQQNCGFVSPRCREILGLARQDEQYDDFRNLLCQHIHPDDRPQLQQTLTRYLAATPTTASLEQRLHLQRPDGTDGWLLLRGKAERDEAGHALRLSGSLTDITTAVQAEIAERQAMAEKLRAEFANQAKSGFLANMSHEIRTPLTAIIGFAETLLDTQQSASDRMTSLQAITRNGHHLLQLINNILDISKIESDKLDIERVALSPVTLTEEIRALVMPQVHDKGLDLHIDYQFPLPVSIDSDPLRIKQILLNLCSNAIKFTHTGGLHVRVVCLPDTERIQFEVRDSGIGLTPEQQTRLFTAFSQADVSTTRQYGGTGLGLHLSRRLAKLLGGDLTVTSEPNVGSCFTLTLATGPLDQFQFINETPLLPEMAQPANATTTPLLAGRVLLADDNPDNQRLISMYIKRTGAEVVIAENGQQVVDFVQQELFDLILMDMQMPVMDGLEATRLLRSNAYRGAIVALTANAFHEDRLACLAAGCNDFLTKPIARHVLFQTLAAHLPARTAPRPNTDPIVSALLAEEPSFIDVVTTFVGRLVTMVRELEIKLTDLDWPELKRISHDVKGVGGSYGYPQVTAVAAKLEFEIAKKDRAACTARLIELHELANRIVYGLREYKRNLPSQQRK